MNHLHSGSAPTSAGALSSEWRRIIHTVELLGSEVCVVARDHRVLHVSPRLELAIGGDRDRPCHEYLFGRRSPCASCMLTDVLEGEVVRIDRGENDGVGAGGGDHDGSVHDGAGRACPSLAGAVPAYSTVHSPLRDESGSIVGQLAAVRGFSCRGGVVTTPCGLACSTSVEPRAAGGEAEAEERAVAGAGGGDAVSGGGAESGRPRSVPPASTRRTRARFSGVVGTHPRMLDIMETIADVAAVNVPVLIQGENGTGKELVARAIHDSGPRADASFIAVNCNALAKGLIESELFGHVRGAFSGADRDKRGRFERADGGTLFLDEVGDLDPAIQVSLLRVLQEGEFERVGDEKPVRVDVRIVSATNRDLARLVANGRFREDLYYRLCVVPITMPALRERRRDLGALVAYLLRLACEEMGRPVPRISAPAWRALENHRWPGNVRELRNAIGHAVVKCKGRTIERCHLPLPVLASPGGGGGPGRRGRKPKVTADAVARALSETGGNKVAAARKLGVSRATLYRYLPAV